MPTNLYTDVTIGDREFAIKRFDAKTGLKLARLVLSKAAPIIPMLDAVPDGEGQKEDRKPEDSAKVYEAVGAILGTLSDADLDDLVNKSLQVCYAKLPAGLHPVMDENGNYGVEDIEYDMGLTIRLCFEAIKWGASDFFDGKNLLSGLLTKQTGK